MKRIDIPVLVVGGGPTGMTSGLLLAQHGIANHVIERRSGPQRAPAAHAINARTFEIWRQAGMDMDTILAAANDPADAGFVYWVTKMGGEILGLLPYERQGDEVLRFTPTPLRNLSQHRLEPLLAESVHKEPLSTLLYEHQWESSVQDATGILSRVRDLQSGDSYEVKSEFVIAADGAGSPVRKSLGIEPIGPDRIQSFVMIHFEANLRSIVRDCPGVMYWISDPSCPGIFVAHDIDQEWVYMHTWDPESDPIDRYDAAHCESIIRRAFVSNDFDLTIRNVSPWMMTSQIAERYREKSIFLAGDAAHRFPPTGGLGLNTGVQDAHNLVWKIAATRKGWADSSLLDTYEVERKPIAHYNAEQSFQNAARLLEVSQAMGVAAAPDEALKQFNEMLKDEVRRDSVRQTIENQAEHFDMLGLQLGYSYESGALLPDGADRRVASNPVREFIPSSAPGSRLPHGWIERDGRRVSTLDLVPPDRFTLFVGPDVPFDIDTARPQIGLPLNVVRIARDIHDLDNWWGSVARMSDRGILLVRPDQHVAFRSLEVSKNPIEHVAASLQAILGREGLVDSRSTMVGDAACGESRVER